MLFLVLSSRLECFAPTPLHTVDLRTGNQIKLVSLNLIGRARLRPTKFVQWVKALAIRPDELNSILRKHMAEGNNLFLGIVI